MTQYERATVSFSRQVNDGSYGSETIRVELIVVPSDGQAAVSEQDAADALIRARAIVHAELAKSSSYSVRRAVEEPKPDTEDLPL